MKLTSRETYYLDGQAFNSLKAAQVHLENEIGKILDCVPVRLNPKDALAVHEAIIKHKARLVDLLTVEIEPEEWDGQGRNLLDMDL
jgi:hypothetical protein